MVSTGRGSLWEREGEREGTGEEGSVHTEVLPPSSPFALPWGENYPSSLEPVRRTMLFLQAILKRRLLQKGNKKLFYSCLFADPRLFPQLLSPGGSGFRSLCDSLILDRFCGLQTYKPPTTKCLFTSSRWRAALSVSHHLWPFKNGVASRPPAPNTGCLFRLLSEFLFFFCAHNFATYLHLFNRRMIVCVPLWVLRYFHTYWKWSDEV